MVEKIKIHEEKYDPQRAEWVNVEIPTVTVKRARMKTGPADNRLIASYAVAAAGTISGEWHSAKTMRVTRLRIAADQAAWFMVCDNSGTIDFPYLEAAGGELDLGGPDAPVYSVKGTFTVRQYGSYGAGTWAVGFEGLVCEYGTEQL